MPLTLPGRRYRRASASCPKLSVLAMVALSLVTVLAGCGHPAAPSTTPEPTVAYTPPPPPSTTPTPLPPITMRVFPDVDIAATGAGVSFVADTNVAPQALPVDCSWEWDFGDASGKVTR